MPRPHVVVVLPAYNAARTLKQTVKDIPRSVVNEVILVDDSSQDDTIAVAKKLKLTVIRHTKNLGYGGNQKTCYTHALKTKANIIAMIHPDYQYDPKLLPVFVQLLQEGYFDLMLGTRIRSRHESLAGGMPVHKYFANRALTLIENILSGYNLSEWHTGMRVYRREVLETIPFEHNSNNFVFDTQVLFQAIEHNFRIGEISVPVRYMPEASSINFRESLRYGWETMGVALRHWYKATFRPKTTVRTK